MKSRSTPAQAPTGLGRVAYITETSHRAEKKSGRIPGEGGFQVSGVPGELVKTFSTLAAAVTYAQKRGCVVMRSVA